MEPIRTFFCPIQEEEIKETDCKTCPPPHPQNCPYKKMNLAKKKKIPLSNYFFHRYEAIEKIKDNPFDVWRIRHEEEKLKHANFQLCLRGRKWEALSRDEQRKVSEQAEKRSITKVFPQIEKMQRENERTREARYKKLEELLKISSPSSDFRESITQSADWYLVYKTGTVGKPRQAKIQRDMKKVSVAAKKLWRILQTLDDETRNELKFGIEKITWRIEGRDEKSGNLISHNLGYMDLARARADFPLMEYLRDTMIYARIRASQNEEENGVFRSMEKFAVIHKLANMNEILNGLRETWETERIDRIEEDSHLLHSIAEGLLKRLPQDKGGRPFENQGLVVFIQNLKNIYENIIGKKVDRAVGHAIEDSSYEFFRLVRLCLEYIDPKSIWSDQALDGQIRRALNLP